MSAVTVTRCGLCGSDRLDMVLSLGSSPPTCVMVPIGVRQATEHHHPLELLRCHDCTLVQLSVVVDPEIVFPPEYPYSSGNSQGLHRNFEDLARQADGYVGGLLPADLVVDIGANDGTLLSKFTGCRTVGVEPTGQARRIDGPAYQEFFTEKLARQIREQHGPAKVITACNVLAHVPDIDEVMRGVKVLLADDGVFIAENHDLQSVVDGQWDTVYHEHVRFYDPHSFHIALDRIGIQPRDWKKIDTHGGSFRVFADRGSRPMLRPAPRDYDFETLAADAADARAAIRCTALEHPGIWAIGATARATTIINYCGLDVEDITCVCEVKGSDKLGHYIPGTRIPVVDEARLFEEQPDRVLLLSWHLADVIVPKLREKGYTGEIILPLPALEHV